MLAREAYNPLQTWCKRIWPLCARGLRLERAQASNGSQLQLFLQAAKESGAGKKQCNAEAACACLRPKQRPFAMAFALCASCNRSEAERNLRQDQKHIPMLLKNTDDGPGKATSRRFLYAANGRRLKTALPLPVGRQKPPAWIVAVKRALSSRCGAMRPFLRHSHDFRNRVSFPQALHAFRRGRNRR